MQDAERRLLDLLAGWTSLLSNFSEGKYNPTNYDQGDYVPSEEELTQFREEENKVQDLYQAVAMINFNKSTLEYDEPTPDQIEQFIKDKIIPLVLKG